MKINCEEVDVFGNFQPVNKISRKKLSFRKLDDKNTEKSNFIVRRLFLRLKIDVWHSAELIHFDNSIRKSNI